MLVHQPRAHISRNQDISYTSGLEAMQSAMKSFCRLFQLPICSQFYLIFIEFVAIVRLLYRLKKRNFSMSEA